MNIAIQQGGIQPSLNYQDNIFGEFLSSYIVFSKLHECFTNKSKLLKLCGDNIVYQKQINIDGILQGGVKIGEQIQNHILTPHGNSLDYATKDFNYLQRNYSLKIGTQTFHLIRSAALPQYLNLQAQELADPMRMENIMHDSGKTFLDLMTRLTSQLADDLDNELMKVLYYTDAVSQTNSSWTPYGSKRAAIQWCLMKNPDKILNLQSSTLPAIVSSLDAPRVKSIGLLNAQTAIDVGLPSAYVETETTLNMQSLYGPEDYMTKLGIYDFYILGGKHLETLFKNPKQPYQYGTSSTMDANWASNANRKLYLTEKVSQNPGIVCLRYDGTTNSSPYQTYGAVFLITSVIPDFKTKSYNLTLQVRNGSAGTEQKNSLLLGNAVSNISSQTLSNGGSTPTGSMTYYLDPRLPLIFSIRRYSNTDCNNQWTAENLPQNDNWFTAYISKAVSFNVVTGRETVVVNISMEQLAFLDDTIAMSYPTADGGPNISNAMSLCSQSIVVSTVTLPEITMFTYTGNVANIPRLRNINGMQFSPLFLLGKQALQCVVQEKDTNSLAGCEDGKAFLKDMIKQLDDPKHAAYKAEFEKFYIERILNNNIPESELPSTVADLKSMLSNIIQNPENGYNQESLFPKSIDFKSLVSLNMQKIINAPQDLKNPLNVQFNVTGNFSVNKQQAAIYPVFKYPDGFCIYDTNTSFATPKDIPLLAKYHVFQEGLSLKHLLIGRRFDYAGLTNVKEDIIVEKLSLKNKDKFKNTKEFWAYVENTKDSEETQLLIKTCELYNTFCFYEQDEYLAMVNMIDVEIVAQNLNLRKIEDLKKYLNQVSKDKLAHIVDILFFSYEMQIKELKEHFALLDNSEIRKSLEEHLEGKINNKYFEYSCFGLLK